MNNIIMDESDALRSHMDKLRARIKELEMVLGVVLSEHNATKYEVMDFGYSDGLYLNMSLYKLVSTTLRKGKE